MNKDKIRSLCRQYEKKKLSVKNLMDGLEKEGVPCWVVFIIADLHHKVSYLTNLSKLDPEDQAVAAKWEEEREERARFFSDIADLDETGEHNKATEMLQNIPETPMECEHGRHIVKFCHSCDHIERTLFPDMFEDDIEEDDE